ncbi:hypothetical protein [Delftia acidovorans]|uniref:hypothetical protein n=1 Tax=Delftia acidovorans TaxID=80866 RepID=UPI00192B8336|nr:hypothetical protein [Delftia acidovorans]
MRYCEINKQPIDCSKITVDHHSFGKFLPPEEVNICFLKIDFSDAITNFSKYYQDFIDRESEDEEFYEELEGDYKYLHDTGYISFEKMLTNQSELLSRVLLKILPSEFMGYLFSKKTEINQEIHILQTLNSVDINDGNIICTGHSFSINSK